MKKVQKLFSCSVLTLMAVSQFSPAPVWAVENVQEEEDTGSEQTPTNVALNKPVLAAAGNGARAVDGDITTYWDGGPAPSELFVDLENFYDVSSINVVPYYGGSRAYHYEVYVSSDGSLYKKVGEKTDDNKQTSAGETYEMDEVGVRYVRVRMTYNSANPSVHINELRVMGVLNENFEPPISGETDPEDPDNLAYGKPTRTTTNASFAGLVNDGDRNTSWSGEDYPKYVDVDLMDNYDLSAVKVYMPEDAQYAYTVYTSTDGVHFDRLHESPKKESEPDGDLITLETPLTARVIRVSCMANSKGEGANSRISEIRAYGTKSEVPVTETRTDLNLQSYDDWMQENYGVDVESLKDETGHYDVNDTFTDEDVYTEVRDLITRVLGEEYNDWFTLELAPSENPDADYYELSMQDGKVHIKGNEGLSLTSALNHYLKYYCNVHVSQQTMQTSMPAEMPAIEGTVRKDSPYEVRYAYNYCTLSYTMPFWGYDEWQRELDWFALNGVNLILDTTATEALWVEYLQNYGYTIDEAKAFVCGYSYKAWWLMGNLEGYGGPVSDEWIKDTVQMARVNQRRMHVLGMQPCLQGFMGAMPENFASMAKQVLLDKGYENIADYMVEQGDWSGFTRPPILKTTYDGWNELADTFYQTQEMIYGQATKYYAGDLAHEGGIIPPDLSKPEMSAHILNKMMDYDPDAVWIIQSWLSNPNKEILQGFGENREDHVLVLDLDATENPHWSNTTNWNGKEFGGTSWVFCMLDNYGGRTGLHGELEYLASAITKANASSSHMKGIGITPEGTLLNPVNYDLFWEMAWETEDMDLDWWLDHYLERRYGMVDDSIREAWSILLDTAYSYNQEDGSYKYHTGNNNCITNMRPSFDPEIVIGDYEIPYDAAAFEKVMSLMMKDFDQLKDNECYVYDMVDILRQTTANAQVEFFYRIQEAYDTGNLDLFTKYKNKMLESILILDELAGFQKDSLYGTWIDKAVNFTEDPRNSEYDDFSKDLMVINAKAICSIWSSKTLQTYGHRQYAGMERDYNYPMWKLWLDRVETAVQTGSYQAPSSNVDYFNIGWDMVTNGNLYETEPYSVDGSEDHRSMTEIFEDIRDNYSTVSARRDEVIDDNIASEGSAYASGTLGSYAPERINDGNTGTLWINSSSQVPAYCGLTFSTKKDIYGVTLFFEPRPTLGANVMDIHLDALQVDGTYKTIWTGQTYNAEKQSYTIEVPLEENIVTSDLRLVFTSNGGIYPALGEMKVYASGGIVLLDGSDMFKSGSELCGIPDGWTVAQVKEWLQIGGGELIFLRGESELADDAVIEEGDSVILRHNANIIDRLSLSLASSLKTRLTDLLAECRTLDPADYSDSSWILLDNRMSAAQKVLDNESSTPSAHRSAMEALQRAADGLVSIKGFAETLARLESADTDYLSSANQTFFTENLNAAKEAAPDLKAQDASAIYTAKANLENAENALLPADNSNIASAGSVYVDNSLSSYYGANRLIDGIYDNCWVTNSQKTFPVKGGVTFAEGKDLSGVKVVFEQNGYRNTRIGFVLLAQMEDGSWKTIDENQCSAKNGYTFFYDLSDQEGKVKDVRVTLTSWATDAGSPYPGVAELEIYEKTDDSALASRLDDLGNAVFEEESAAAALKQARYAVNNILVSQNFIDASAALLDTSVLPAWKTSLEAQMEAVDVSKYTDASVEVWNKACEEVKAALPEASSFDAMAELQKKIDEAMSQLLVKTNKTLLAQAVSIAEQLKADGALEGVNELVVNNFETALSTAKDVLGNDHATQEEINSAWMELCQAVQMLSFKTDKSELQALVAECEQIDLSEYREDGKEEFTAALNYAKEVLESDTALTDISIKEAVARLTNARNALVKLVSIDTSILAFLIETCDGLNLDQYMEAGKPDFAQALLAAKAVLESPESQVQVDDATRSLSNAYLNLRLKADEELIRQLADLAAEIDALDLDACPTVAARTMRMMRADIQNLLDADEAPKQDVEDLLKKGKDALDELHKTGTLPDPDDHQTVPAGPADSGTDQKVNQKPEQKIAASEDSTEPEKPADHNKSVKTGVYTTGWFAGLGAAVLAMISVARRNKKTE